MDKETLERFRNYIKNIESGRVYSDVSDEQLFEKLRVTINGKVTIAGLLMFGTEDTIGSILPDFMVDYLEIRGTSYSDAQERYTYRMPVQKNLYNYFFSIFERLLTKIDIPFKTKGIFRDENQPQVLAIREALVNLLAHSDYFSNMKPRIRVFLNRIEFMNPGSLPAPVEVLRKRELTIPRNPILIKVFRIMKLAENAGYGFDKMFDGWKSYYKVEPVVENDIIHYKIEFPLTTKWDVPDNVPDKRRADIIELMRRNNKIEISEISAQLKVNEKTIKRDIDKLKREGKIKRIGPQTGGRGHWEVLK